MTDSEVMDRIRELERQVAVLEGRPPVQRTARGYRQARRADRLDKIETRLARIEKAIWGI